MRWLGLVVVAGACRINFEPVDPFAGDGGMSTDSITVIVEGQGIVLASGAAPCVSTCTYDAGVTLTPQPADGWTLAAISAPCSSASPCTPIGGTTITVSFQRAPITANRIFVTSQTVSPSIGITGLDAACASAATAGGLGGTFIAFASTSSVDARTRLAGARGWVRLDGLPVFDTVADLGADSLPRAVLYDEMGTPISEVVMTGSSTTGTATNHCSDWTGTGMYSSGTSGNAGSFMFSTGSGACQMRRIYCMETARNVAVMLAPQPMVPGRIAFVTAQTIASGGGIAAADAACASEATSLPGTYKAWMATTTVSANERVGGVVGIWKRADGFVISWDRLDATVLDAALNIDATGAAHTGGAWLGAQSHDVVGTAMLTCNDWSSTTNTSSRGVSVLSNQPSRWGVGMTCAQTQRVLCAQLP